ncbi:phosphotransferase [Eubacterium sp. MSJ-33]|uniref:phosphotransferase n=1 Tax=Eubacterium sp. MSJ-33 TaxID=2841528 RepID=UPI001EE2369E|nr:NTP transferase domain-containing protein [Eubacterium sp. MSJ-33]
MEYIIVQAGGKGTRLGHLTENKPKALVPVENLPMLFHLFRKYPDKRFIIIADYKKDVLREYLSVFADVKYQVVEAEGNGTCSGLSAALRLIPDGQPFMFIWSDLILPKTFELPADYREGQIAKYDYVGLSETFPCRWKYEDREFQEERSEKYGVAGLFLFTAKEKLGEVPASGEFVRFLKEQKKTYHTVGIGGTREFGILAEYEKLEQQKCRPFNKITVREDSENNRKILVKEAVDAQGESLAKRECAWYDKAKKLAIPVLPEIYKTNPLEMEYIDGNNIYELNFSYEQKHRILEQLILSLKKLHQAEHVPADSFSIHETYYNKTMDRLSKIQDLIPFAREREIRINGKLCRNVYYHKRELEQKLQKFVDNCSEFSFIHGDCTFSNMMIRKNGAPVLIDPRGYFGFTQLYGDVRYDWAKLYYSVVGNYDQFNLKRFHLSVGQSADDGVKLEIQSNQWEDMESDFFALTGCDPNEIKLLHAVIWLSLTTYAWQDYDSVCGAFYNGLLYLEDVL